MIKQNDWVLDYLKVNNVITQRTAYEYGITRLASRINDLRKDGHNIETVNKRVPTRWNNGITRIAEYHYKGEQNGA